MTDTFTTRALQVDLGGRAVLHDVAASIATAAVTAIVGPNGSGKSTLLRSFARLQGYQGSITLETVEVRDVPARQFARKVALLPQAPIAPDNLTVIDLVGRGRDPHRRWFDQWSEADEAVVLAAIRRTGLEAFMHRPLETLSGGQRQRAWIALALAQSTDVLLLDEPTTYLDISHQLEVLETVLALQRERRITVAMVLHDLTLAARFADHVIVMQGGRIAAAGDVAGVFTADLVRNVFAVECSVLTDPRTGRPVMVPHQAVR